MAHPAKAIANYFIAAFKNFKGEFLSPMKLQKLVYFAQGWHLGLNSTRIAEESIEAWPWGPVVPCLYHEFKHFGNGSITQLATEFDWSVGFGEVQTPTLTGDDEQVVFSKHFLDRIIEIYGSFTGIQLSNLTHEPGTPWDIINKQYDGKIPKRVEIPDELMQKYFANLAKKPG